MGPCNAGFKNGGADIYKSPSNGRTSLTRLIVDRTSGMVRVLRGVCSAVSLRGWRMSWHSFPMFKFVNIRR